MSHGANISGRPRKAIEICANNLGIGLEIDRVRYTRLPTSAQREII